MKFRWSIAPGQTALVEELAQRLSLPPLLVQCLLNRGLTGQEAIGNFLQPRLKGLADPFLLPNMTVAVERLITARERQESLVIFGDYDVDGVTSTALLAEVLTRLGWRVSFYLPHRLEEGYGLSLDGVENCLKKNPASLLLAVDCGSTSVESINWLARRGVDVIVLDHHQVSQPAPGALALVNPLCQTQPVDGESPAPALFTELCSVGLAFKLAHALLKRGRERGLPGAADFDLRPLLDLVALGTIADVVPLMGENRILVAAGLERLNTTRRPGLMALKKVAQSPDALGVYDVGFQLAPRLNAAGRLETAEEALHLVMARDLGEAMPLAAKLDGRNRDRQKIEKAILEEALEAVRGKFRPETDFVVVEGRESWHIGVVGIVAARVLQQFYRPTIIVGGEGGEWRGSGRSVAGFDLAAALRECSDLLVRHGGHAMAAGVSLRPEKLPEFRARLNEVARRTLSAEQLQPLLRLDGEVALPQINLESLAALEQLRPSGQGNPAVQFCTRGVVQHRPSQRMGAEKQHVKMWVTDGATVHEAVWWGAGQATPPEGAFDLAFAPSINEFNGRRIAQLKVLDLRPAQGRS